MNLIMASLLGLFVLIAVGQWIVVFFVDDCCIFCGKLIYAENASPSQGSCIDCYHVPKL
jgi:hypothetical protein